MESNLIENKDVHEENLDNLKKRKIRAWCGKCFQTFENGPLSKQCLDHLNKNNCNLIECRKTMNNNTNFKCVRRFKNINSENRHTYCIDMEEVSKWDKNIQIQQCYKNLPKENINVRGDHLKNSLLREYYDENELSNRGFAQESSVITNTVKSENQIDKFKHSNESPKMEKPKVRKSSEITGKIDSNKKTFLVNLSKKNDSKQQTEFNKITSTNVINSNSNDKQSSNFLHEKPAEAYLKTSSYIKLELNTGDLCGGQRNLFQNELETKENILSDSDSVQKINQDDFNINKIFPNKWDQIKISGKNIDKVIPNKNDIFPGLEIEGENTNEKINNIDANLEFKMENFFESNHNDYNSKNLDNLNTSNIKNKIINEDIFFNKQNLEMNEESLVSQLDKIDFNENSKLKYFTSKGHQINPNPNYLPVEECNFNNQNNKINLFGNTDYNLNPNNNQTFNNLNVNNENAIIKQVFGNENLIKNDSYSSMSICTNTSVEEFNDYVIKNDTDLDLIFDMIYKCQKISLDVMYNLRNKLRFRGFNTVLSLRLKKEREKCWRFLYEDYKDISPEIEGVALLIEYYLEKKLTK